MAVAATETAASVAPRRHLFDNGVPAKRAWRGPVTCPESPGDILGEAPREQIASAADREARADEVTVVRDIINLLCCGGAILKRAAE